MKLIVRGDAQNIKSLFYVTNQKYTLDKDTSLTKVSTTTNGVFPKIYLVNM